MASSFGRHSPQGRPRLGRLWPKQLAAEPQPDPLYERWRSPERPVHSDQYGLVAAIRTKLCPQLGQVAVADTGRVVDVDLHGRRAAAHVVDHAPRLTDSLRHRQRWGGATEEWVVGICPFGDGADIRPIGE